jgi:hypothetical protein
MCVVLLCAFPFVVVVFSPAGHEPWRSKRFLSHPLTHPLSPSLACLTSPFPSILFTADEMNGGGGHDNETNYEDTIRRMKILSKAQTTFLKVTFLPFIISSILLLSLHFCNLPRPTFLPNSSLLKIS